MSEEKELQFELAGGVKLVPEFAKAMQLKMEQRAGKYGSPRKYSFGFLKEHLLGELRELVESNFSAEECIDVANMCCLVWDKRMVPLRKAGED